MLKTLVQDLQDFSQTRSVTFGIIWTVIRTPDASQFSDNQLVSCDPFTEFVEMSPDEVRKVISNVSCNVDPHPTWLLKQH